MTNILNVQYMYLNYVDIVNGPEALITWISPDYLHEQFTSQAIGIGTVQDLGASPLPVFTDVASAISYYNNASAQIILDGVNTDLGQVYYTAYSITALDPVTNAAINATIAMIPSATSELTNDSGYLTPSSLAGYETASAAAAAYVPKTTTVNGHALSGNITVTASDLGLATVASSGSYNDLSNKPTIPTNVPKVYNGTTLRTNPVEYTNTGTVSSGSVVFQVTDDGTSTGNALLPNNRDFIIASVSSTTSQYGFSFTWSNSNKTLTVGVSAITSALGILGIATAVNGIGINIFVKGN